jgi:hypothetical protein
VDKTLEARHQRAIRNDKVSSLITPLTGLLHLSRSVVLFVALCNSHVRVTILLDEPSSMNHSAQILFASPFLKVRVEWVPLDPFDRGKATLADE